MRIYGLERGIVAVIMVPAPTHFVAWYGSRLAL